MKIQGDRDGECRNCVHSVLIDGFDVKAKNADYIIFIVSQARSERSTEDRNGLGNYGTGIWISGWADG